MKSMKRKYLAQWVQILKKDSPYYEKCGVVMDEEYIHNGEMCCRVILKKDIVVIEHQFLKIVPA